MCELQSNLEEIETKGRASVNMQLRQIMPTSVGANWTEGKKGVMIMHIIQSLERAAICHCLWSSFPVYSYWKAKKL